MISLMKSLRAAACLILLASAVACTDHDTKSAIVEKSSPPRFKFFVIHLSGYTEANPDVAGYSLYSAQVSADGYNVTLIYELEIPR